MNDERMGAAFELNAADLLRYFARRVADAEDAADLLGETMETAWRKARVLPADPAEARMWLFGIARNKLMHHGRALRRRLAAASVLAHTLADDLAHDPSTDDAVIEVRLAVAALPAELGELVRLIHWDGFSAAEAAALLGIPATTARSRHARARQLLETALADRKGSQAARIG